MSFVIEIMVKIAFSLNTIFTFPFLFKGNKYG